MSVPLLSTKFHIQPVRRNAVERQSLADRLQRGEGYHLLNENGAFVSKPLRYPLGLWFDLFLSLWFRR